MKQFFIKLGDHPIYKKLLKEPLTYVAGAVLLAVFQIAHFTALGSGWVYYASEKMQKELNTSFLADGGSIRNLGIVLGAFAATLFASQFKIKKIKSLRQVVAAILGGLLMGYGARLANGCNIGALFTAISAFSLSGWVFGAFLLVGAFLGSKLLAKYFM
ncbi:YeeE/YedE thiosulfate transporter family protein [Lacrimispora brassicae]